jgi:arylsulfatase A-like enzyme
MTQPRHRDPTPTLSGAIGLALVSLPLVLGWLCYAWLGYLNTDQPHASLEAPYRPSTPVLALPPDRPARVILVVLDGLRYDTASEAMPLLRRRAERGEWAWAESPLPSFSRPSYASLATGTTPERAGVITNRYPDPLPLDTIFARVRASKLRTVGAANLDFMRQNFAPFVDAWHYEYHWDQPDWVDAAMREALGDPEASLVVLHFVELDRVAHQEGVGERYRAESGALDLRLDRLLQAVDLDRDALIVTSDHGHLGRGGHGGPEPEARKVPLLLSGRGFAPRQEGRFLGPLGRLAPTISVLLGVEYPRDLTYDPITEALDPEVFPRAYVEARLEEWRRHRAEYERAWLRYTYQAWTRPGWMGEAAPNHVSNSASVPRDASVERLTEARQRTLDEIQRDRRLGRLPLLVLIAAPFGASLAWGSVRGYGLRPALAIPLFGGGAGLALWGLGVPLSFSALNTYAGLMIRLLCVLAVGLWVYGAGLWGLLRHLPPRARRSALRLHATAAALLYAALGPAAWVITGYAVQAPIPPPWLLFWPLLAGVVGGGFAGLMGLLWLASALRPAWWARERA